jgi:seryl-tRNA synthetase
MTKEIGVLPASAVPVETQTQSDVKAWLAEQEAVRQQAAKNQKLQEELQAAKDHIAELEEKLAAKEKAAQAEAHLAAVQGLRPESLQASNPGEQAVAEQTAGQTPEQKAAEARRKRAKEQHDYVRRVQHERRLEIARIVANRLYFHPTRIANLPRSEDRSSSSNFGGSDMWAGVAGGPEPRKKKLAPSGSDGWTPGLGGFSK